MRDNEPELRSLLSGLRELLVAVVGLLVAVIALALTVGGSFLLIKMLLSGTERSALQLVNAYLMVGGGALTSGLSAAYRRRKPKHTPTDPT